MRKSIFRLDYQLGLWAVLSCFFPYISFSLNSFDIQPWYIVFCTAFLMFNIRYVKYLPGKILVLLGLLPLGALFVTLVFQESADVSVRSIASYYGFVVAFLSFFVFNFRYESLNTVIRYSLALWLIVGFIQLTTDPYIFDLLVNVRTSQSRGVTSLSPEPSFYGVVTLSLSLLLFFSSNGKLGKTDLLLIALSLITIGLVAKSAAGILLIPFGIFSAMLFFDFRVKTGLLYILLAIAATAFLYVVLLFLPDSRIAATLPRLLDPTDLIGGDVSVAGRVSHIFSSYYLHVADFGLPHGFSSFREDAIYLAQEHRLFLGVGYQNKIFSAVGAALYELGYFAYALIVIIWLCTIRATTSKLAAFLQSLCIITIFSTAVPISFPFFPAILAVMYFAEPRLRGPKSNAY